jgi:threonine/homoserine/homoserine lactone efflux protein
MRAGLVVAFWGVTVLLIVVPGPDWAFTLAAGLRDRVVYPAVGGLMLGYSLLTAVVAAGVGPLVAHHPVILTGLTVVGAGYLVSLGVGLLARPGSLHQPAATGERPTAAPWPRRVLAGVGVSGLNPKGLLIFLALLPQFTDPGGGPGHLAPLWGGHGRHRPAPPGRAPGPNGAHLTPAGSWRLRCRLPTGDSLACCTTHLPTKLRRAARP